ncbi:cytochrome P450 [Chitinophaga filiformis]|uniref:Cytochrome P450 n=1 Tax=Chitinophaga filiformis TaxID=104663 RepID=A0A1G7HQJ3_CHIFI|nr:cytochrome P450 [Chitinophaga filiformis]SDF02693.1 Cytochrome P450 [Chitinophaga filiformis]
MTHKILFRQSEVSDPYTVYRQRLQEAPVCFDADANVWAVHSYSDCKTVLQHPMMQIPVVSMEGLNEAALLLSGKLVRLSNPPQHTMLREVTMQLHQEIQPVQVDAVLKELLTEPEMDWVKDVCQRLPALLILKGLRFRPSDIALITGCIPRLVSMMLPVKTPVQIATINAVAADIYEVVSEHLQRMNIVDKEYIPAAVSNLVGLLIQSYDAGSGLLANALLHFLRVDERPLEKQYLRTAVQETLRFDPPIHHTRRITTTDLKLKDHTIPAGATIIVVLAAANRDEQQFAHPDQYDPCRSNNNTHLTFGAGIHQCVAHRFSTGMTTEALAWLFEHYPLVQLKEPLVHYAPLLNARIPDNMLITLK